MHRTLNNFYNISLRLDTTPALDRETYRHTDVQKGNNNIALCMHYMLKLAIRFF